MILEIAGFGIAGGLLKVLDDINDGLIRLKRKDAGLWVLAGFCIVMTALILTSIDINIMFIGIAIGTGLSKKIDNIAYTIGLTVLTPFIIYSLFAGEITLASGGLIFVFTLGAYADELFSDREIIDMPFVRRPVLKLATLAVTLGGFYSLTGLLALLAFDLTYDLLGYYTGTRIVSYDKTLRKLK